MTFTPILFKPRHCPNLTMPRIMAEIRLGVVIGAMQILNAKEYFSVTFKTILLAACTVFSLSCTSEVSADDPQKDVKRTKTTVTKTTDEIGNEMVIVKSTRNEGYTVHPSNHVTKTTSEFYCEGYKIQTLFVKREENQEVRSYDFSLRVNSEEIDLKPLFGTHPNIYGYSNVRPQYSCVDQIVRITINGQRQTDDYQLSAMSKIIDVVIDRDTGKIIKNNK